ncbi:MAG: DUF1015 domain-containing protein, partial [Treponema sp.]|nr:DUF1015 domain-containing protein [Treponema sp.]
AVIACDQFTQDRSYWEGIQNALGGAPSTFNIILPEIYLNDNRDRRIRDIHRTMAAYLEEVLAPPRRGCVYVERSTPFHPRRRGLVFALDLEQYDWQNGSCLLARSTEDTVAERLPPRMEVRRDASLESPHVLLLIDDDEDALLPALGKRAGETAPAYHAKLRAGSGELSGWFLETEADWTLLAEGLEALARRAENRYGSGVSGKPFLYAVGDGNHSLASAKGVWEEYKLRRRGEPGLEHHPARWALVELENLYDPGLSFEPIHRLIFGAAAGEMLDCLSALPGFTSRPAADREELSGFVETAGTGKNRLGLISGGGGPAFTLVETEAPGLAPVSLQPLLDQLLRSRRDCSIDYIHGKDALFRLALDPGRTVSGILLPPVNKNGLFQTIAAGGPLPRKSFSMGEAEEKRFYFECRKLF